MVALSLAFFAGTLSAFAWQHNPARWLTVCIAGFGLTCFLLRYQMQGRCAGPASRRAMLLAGLTAAACAGCAYELACIHAALARRWPPEHADERVFVRARLDGLSARGSAGVSFDAWISPVHEPHAW